MATFDQIYDFEGALYPALADLYLSGGIERVFYQRMSGVPVLPYLSLKLTIGSATGHVKILADGVPVEDMWNASLETEIHSQRARNVEGVMAGSDVHRNIVVKARQTMARWKAHFNSTNLPYHAIGEISSAGDTPRIEAEDDEDISSLIHHLVFQIRPSAWPV